MISASSRPALVAECEPRRVELRPEADVAARLADLLGFAPISVDELIRASGLQPRAVQAALVELEVSGAVTRHDGNRVARRAVPDP